MLLKGVSIWVVLGLLSSSAWARVHVRVDWSSPEGSLFPSDQFTIRDSSQTTGLRVNLPKPDCAARASECEDVDVLNTLDGFSLQPRISIPFDGPIDLGSVSPKTVFLLRLYDTLHPRFRSGKVISLNQLVWEPSTNTLYARPNEVLDQHTRYALVVTSGICDQHGSPVTTLRQRESLSGNTRDWYGKEAESDLALALANDRFRSGEVLAVSIFTTQSATALLEKMRRQIHATAPSIADFNLAGDDTRTVFSLEDIETITWHRQTGANPPSFTDVPVNLALLRDTSGAIGQIAFGRYSSPDYMVHPGEYIPPVGTRHREPVVQAMSDIYFNLYLPSGEKPASGWPVAIFGHGGGGSKDGRGIVPGPPEETDNAPAVASTMAAHGIATIAINLMGNGFGPLSTLAVNRRGLPPIAFPAGGRGVDQNRDGQIGVAEGSEAAPPRTLLSARDGFLQTISDLLQLVRVIDAGIDVDHDGQPDLDPKRIYYFGQSLGAMYGMAFTAVEPAIQAAVFNVPGPNLVENRRLSPLNRPMVAGLLAARQPSLLNSPGIVSIAGVSTGKPYFDENAPLRAGVPIPVGLEDGTEEIIQSPVVNTVPGALDLQEWLHRAAWAQEPANPIAYASHLRKQPLPGIPVRPFLIQMARGDQIVPNPLQTALLRAGSFADVVTLYRHDLAYAQNPEIPKNPHMFLTEITIPSAAGIARAAQEQIACFFASGGTEVMHPEPADWFEMPIHFPLPEDFGFIP